MCIFQLGRVKIQVYRGPSKVIFPAFKSDGLTRKICIACKTFIRTYFFTCSYCFQNIENLSAVIFKSELIACFNMKQRF